MSPPVTPPLPDVAAGKFASRSLHDEGLKRFLVENLGAVPANWDAEALGWVAFYFHPSLEVARAQWAVARAAQQSAAARQNPTLALIPGYNTTREPGVSPWFPAINFDFLLRGGDKRARQQDIAQADAEAARLAVLAAVWPVHVELGGALSDVAAATRRERALRAQGALQGELVSLLERRVAAGAATAGEVTAARLAALRTAAAAADAASQREHAKVRTAIALGLPVATLAELALPDSPPTVALTDEALVAARRLSLQSRADVLAALAKVQSAEAALALETANRVPDFHLGPGYQWDQGGNKWSVALTFELPVFQRNEGPIAEALARRAEAVAQFNAVQAQAVAAIETAVVANSTSATQLEHARRVRDELTQQLALAQQRLALGAASQPDVLAARIELAAAEAAVAEAQNTVGLAAGQLEDALQIPFPNLAKLARTP